MSRVTLVVNRHGTTSETFQRTLAAELTSGGHEVTVHALRAGPNDVASTPAVEASYALPPAGRPAALAGGLARTSPRDLWAMSARARARFGLGRRGRRAVAVAAPIYANRPDVIHVGFSGIGVGIADALDLLDDVPLVVSCRGTDELVRPLLDPDRGDALGRLFEQASVVHAVADAVADAARNLGADRSKIRVIRPAVDLSAWKPRAVEPDGPTWQLVTVTRLVPAKGVEDLISALAILVEGGIDARLRIVGDGPGADGLRLRTIRSGLGERVDFVGSCAPGEVRDEVAAAHVFVSSSLSEGINNAVLEAMALGVAVVSTEVGGMAEVIRPGIDGLLVPSGRPDRLAAALTEALENGGERTLMAARGRERVRDAFSLDRQAAHWLQVYDEFSDGSGGSSKLTRGPEGKR